LQLTTAKKTTKKQNSMLNHSIKSLLLCAVPCLVAAGCAHRSESTATYSTPPAALTATSEGPDQRVYANAPDAPTVFPPPTGAATKDWSIGEGIRELFIADKTLAPRPSSVTATVDKDAQGTVTLRGSVPNTRERQRIEERIAQIPGVEHINNKLDVANSH
jgi:hypothetical protein